MIRTHALYTRLTRRAALPALPRLAQIIGAAWAATLIVAFLPVWRVEAVARPAITAMQAVGFGLMLIIPPITAGYAAALASLEADRAEFELARISLLTKKAIVRDLYHAALFRLRGLYAAMFALLPALLISGLYKGMVTGREAITSSGIMVVGVGIWFGLATLLGAGLGVCLGLRWRNHPAPLALAPALLIALMGLGAVALVCPFYFAAPIALTALLDQAEKYA